MIGISALSLSGCATPTEPKPIPAHPFPNWVDQLEIGQTQIEDIRNQVGAPDEIKQNVRGERIWRFVFREIQWPDDDPMRPVVSADGTLERKAPTRFTRMADGIRVVKNWIDGAMYFPPRQVRPPRTRLLPATVHRLEVIFDETGALRRFEYVPRGGFTKVAATR